MTAFLARWQTLPGNVRGAVYLTLTAILLSCGAFFIKRLGQSLPSYEIILLRNLFVMALTLAFCFPRGRPSAFATDHLGLHLARGCLSFLSMSAFYWSYANLPLAESTALMYTLPLFLIVLSVVFTGARVGWRRTLATTIGFTGVVVMLAPGMTSVEPLLLVPLSIGLTDAIITLVIKRLTETESLASILLYMCLVSLFWSAVTVAVATFVFPDGLLGRLAAWRDPTPTEWTYAAGLACVSLLAQVFNVMGWRAGDPTAVAPASYSQIVFAGLVGFLVFGETPEPWAALGAAIIIASTFYIVRREARLQRLKTIR